MVVRSSAKSRREGTVSLLAVMETLGSTLAVWLLAEQLSVYWILIVSVAIGFLVLLRSDESVSWSNEVFASYENGTLYKVVPKYAVLLGVYVGFAVVVASVALLTQSAVSAAKVDGPDSLNGYRALYGHSVFAGLIFFTLLSSLLTIFRKAQHEKEKSYFTSNIVIASFFCFLIGLHPGGAAIGALVGMAAEVASKSKPPEILFSSLSFFTAIYAYLLFGDGFLDRIFIIFLVFMSIYRGVTTALSSIAASLAIRFVSVAKYLYFGLTSIPKNWIQQCFVNDFFMQPELMPGLNPNSNFSYKRLILSGKNDVTTPLIFTYFGAVAYYAHTLIYRYYIKSTFWIYFPLLWAGHIPQRYAKQSHKQLTTYYSKIFPLDWMRLIGSVVAIGIWALLSFDFSEYAGNVKASTDANLSVTYLHLLSGLDFDQENFLLWLPTLSAGLWLVVFTYKAIRFERIDNTKSANEWTIWLMIKLSQICKYASILWIGIGSYSLTYAITVRCKLPAAAYDVLDALGLNTFCP